MAIGELSGDRQVIVLASEAVIGPNVPDFTEDIYARTRQLADASAMRRGQTVSLPADTSGIEAFLEGLSAELEAIRGGYDRGGNLAPEDRQ
jgi:hypothetical protein